MNMSMEQQWDDTGKTEVVEGKNLSRYQSVQRKSHVDLSRHVLENKI
jgi:hypothetical protein